MKMRKLIIYLVLSKIHYLDNTGSGLGKQGIREHIKEILEGGEMAFIKREQKYGIGK